MPAIYNLMIGNNSIDFIYMSHILEHFPINDIKLIIWETTRVLRNDGVLRISVPDFDVLIQVYLEENRDIKSIDGYLMGEQNYLHNYHYSIVNRNYLADLLLHNGFKEVRVWDPENCDYHNFKDCYEEYITGRIGSKYLLSLNLETIK